MKKRLLTLFIVLSFLFTALVPAAYAGQTKDIGSGWSFRLDTPDTAKPYHHIHVYYKGSEVYCLRLDNLKPCDGGGKYKKFEDLPGWVQKSIMNDSAVKKKIKDLNPKSESWAKMIPKWAVWTAVAVTLIAAVVLTVIPGADVGAWAAFLSALAAA